MSLNDLLHVLSVAKPDFLQHDYNTAARAVDSIIKTLDDQNGEVQNMAIKWLERASKHHGYVRVSNMSSTVSALWWAKSRWP